MKSLFLATIVATTGSVAVAQEPVSETSDNASLQIEADEVPRFKRNTVELRPFDTLVSAVPGIAAVGGTFESHITSQWAVVVGGTYADIDISRRNLELVEEETDEPLVSSGYGFAAGAGLRFYEDPIGDSIYAGGQIDYSEVRADWEYEDSSYRSTQYAVIPSLAAGYRWVWQNGLMARLGAGAGLPKVDSQSVNQAPALLQSSDDGAERIEDLLDQQVVAKIDVGIGFSF